MSDSEKLMALKKAYADIILNTAKEAAARIIVSERKAMRYQRELFAAKEDALHMLLRLKQMLDAKVNEAQVASLRQQRKIEELEAQLGEAEDIVRDLRAELREAQDELEKATNNQMQLVDERNLNGDVATPVTTSLENRLNTSEAVVSSLPGTRSELVATSDVRNLPLKGMYEGKCYSENGSHKENCYFCNSDFASIMMRRKEPKLYRNGCTQRIHAFERDLVDENLSLPGQVDDAKNGKSIGEDGEDVCKNLDPGTDKMCGIVNNPNELKIMQANNNCLSVGAFKSFRRKRKRGARHKRSRTLSFRNFPDQLVETIQESDLSCPQPFPDTVDNNVQHEDSEIFEYKAEKDSESLSALKLPLDTTEITLQSECVEGARGVLEFCNASSVQNITNDDDSLINTLELARKESGYVESSEVPACRTDLQAVDVSLLNSDVKASNLTEGIATQPLNAKFLKYTFQRKRKRESSSRDGDSSAEESIMKIKTGEQENGSLDSQNSSLKTASSRDGRRLAQVARQLISLSEKKRW